MDVSFIDFPTLLPFSRDAMRCYNISYHKHIAVQLNNLTQTFD